MDPAEADGENLGIVKFGARGAAALVDIMDRIVRRGAAARLGAARLRGVRAAATRCMRSARAGLPWIEIDFPEDYQRARATTCSRRSSGRRPSPPCRPPRHPGLRSHVSRVHSRSRRASRQTGSRPGADRRASSRIGGGTGLPNVLRGLRPLLFAAGTAGRTPRDRLVAVVATSDDGGSSGRLRAEFNIIPPGDIRNCLAALSENHALIADIFQYRFDSGEGLNGHAIGNLLLDGADRRDARLRARGRDGGAAGRRARHRAAGDARDGDAGGEIHDGRVLSGETSIAKAGGAIGRLSLLPERPACLRDVCEALRRADVIVAGPGSLYTSILPPLLVPDVTRGRARSRRRCAYSSRT